MSLNRHSFYNVADVVPTATIKTFFGASLNVDQIMQARHRIKARWTGEKRAPKAGEWYLSGSIIEAYRAPNNLTTEFHIAKLVPTETVTITREVAPVA